ncbi:MAG TPA: thioredoxin family protein [archaeon]|nr:thioredoxin family protein [archaeon]
MNKPGKIAIVAVLVLAVSGVLVFKQINRTSADQDIKKSGSAAGESFQKKQALPQLVDLGADKCIPCKMMAPILEELKEEYKGRLKVTFIDVWKDPAPGRQYGIRAIPTQIFLDPAGKELFRHEGFYSKDDILRKWRELGFILDKG